MKKPIEIENFNLPDKPDVWMNNKVFYILIFVVIAVLFLFLFSSDVRGSTYYHKVENFEYYKIGDTVSSTAAWTGHTDYIISDDEKMTGTRSLKADNNSNNNREAYLDLGFIPTVPDDIWGMYQYHFRPEHTDAKIQAFRTGLAISMSSTVLLYQQNWIYYDATTCAQVIGGGVNNPDTGLSFEVGSWYSTKLYFKKGGDIGLSNDGKCPNINRVFLEVKNETTGQNSGSLFLYEQNGLDPDDYIIGMTDAQLEIQNVWFRTEYTSYIDDILVTVQDQDYIPDAMPSDSIDFEKFYLTNVSPLGFYLVPDNWEYQQAMSINWNKSIWTNTFHKWHIRKINFDYYDINSATTTPDLIASTSYNKGDIVSSAFLRPLVMDVELHSGGTPALSQGLYYKYVSFELSSHYWDAIVFGDAYTTPVQLFGVWSIPDSSGIHSDVPAWLDYLPDEYPHKPYVFDPYGLSAILLKWGERLNTRFPFSWIYQFYDAWTEQRLIMESSSAIEPMTVKFTVATTTPYFAGQTFTVVDFKTVTTTYGDFVTVVRTLLLYAIYISGVFLIFERSKAFWYSITQSNV